MEFRKQREGEAAQQVTIWCISLQCGVQMNACLLLEYAFVEGLFTSHNFPELYAKVLVTSSRKAQNVQFCTATTDNLPFC
jgi:hypothetical protein